MAKSTPLEKSELSKIIGESYFNLKAIWYIHSIFSRLQRKKKESGTIQILPIGLCALQTKDYESAIAQFNKIIGKDFVAQNAYYHLGVISIPIKTTSSECF
jgi:hypothetical protein